MKRTILRRRNPIYNSEEQYPTSSVYTEEREEDNGFNIVPTIVTGLLINELLNDDNDSPSGSIDTSSSDDVTFGGGDFGGAGAGGEW